MIAYCFQLFQGAGCEGPAQDIALTETDVCTASTDIIRESFYGKLDVSPHEAEMEVFAGPDDCTNDQPKLGKIAFEFDELGVGFCKNHTGAHGLVFSAMAENGLCAGSTPVRGTAAGDAATAGAGAAADGAATESQGNATAPAAAGQPGPAADNTTAPPVSGEGDGYGAPIEPAAEPSPPVSGEGDG